MGPIYGMLSVAGWAFFVGLLGYVMVASRRPRMNGTDEMGTMTDDRPEES